MKFTIETAPLKNLLAKLSAPPGEETAHIGTLALAIKADGFEGVTLRRTTANANIVAKVAADVVEDGQVAVDHGMLTAALTGFASKTLVFAIAGTKLEISSGRSKATLGLFNPEDIIDEPQKPEAKAKTRFVSTELDRALSVTGRAASQDNSRPSLAGACLRTMLGRVAWLGTDGRRVAVALFGESKAPFGNAEKKNDRGVLLVNQSVEILRRIIAGDEAAVDVEVSAGAFTATIGDITATLPVGEQQPPNVDSLMPWEKAPEQKAACNRAELLKFTQSCVPLGVAEYKVLGIHLSPGTLTIQADNERGTTVTHELDAETDVLDTLELRATGAFLVDFIQAGTGETITIETHDTNRMIVERGDGWFNALLLVRDKPQNG